MTKKGIFRYTNLFACPDRETENAMVVVVGDGMPELSENLSRLAGLAAEERFAVYAIDIRPPLSSVCLCHSE